MFPEWVNEAIAEAADPTEGYFTEKIRQRELTNALGQVTCDGGFEAQNAVSNVDLWSCPKCGAAV